MISRSPTQRELAPTDIATYLKTALPGERLVDCAEIAGGGYATVWRAALHDGREVVFKIGPPPGVPQLRYERDLMAAEADYYRTVRPLGVPVPQVLHAEEDWLCVSFLPGTPLSSLDQDLPGVRAELGAAMAKVHGVTGQAFGYTGDRPHGPVWADVFAEMIEDLLADAVDWEVALPLEPQRFRDFVRNGSDVLAEVRRPTLVHFDLWDGNVLCSDGHLTGLVDGERFLYGDPLVDFVSPAMSTALQDVPSHPFTGGYRPAVVWDEAAMHRLALYRMHLFLLMAVEVPSRGMGSQERDMRAQWLLRECAALSTVEGPGVAVSTAASKPAAQPRVSPAATCAGAQPHDAGEVEGGGHKVGSIADRIGELGEG